MMLGEILENLRSTAPLVHNITNYVTANDCANILLACGASPIMADDEAEAVEIAELCASLNINIGTLNTHTIPAMFAAGARATALEHPTLLDPVGAGASKLRTETALALMEKIPFTAIRGNVSEMKILARGCGTTRGVDADAADCVNEENLCAAVDFAMRFASASHAVIVMTGVIDVVADAKRACAIRNGHPMMSRVTGTGCMLSAMTAAYLAAERERPFEAAVASVCAMGLCGERAALRLGERDGNASFRNYIIDEVCNLDGEVLERGAKYEFFS